MGDGSYRGKGILLCTDSFKIKDHSKKYPIIYISKKYIIPLQKIVLPYMHRSMFYKLGKKKKESWLSGL